MQTQSTNNRPLFVSLAITGALGVLLSLVVTLEKIELLIDPSHSAICNLNKFVSCTSVISSPEASMFLGVPNSLWGLIGFSVVTSFGVFGLAVRDFPQWLWTAFSVGMFLALLFCLFLSWVTFFVIGAMCLYCVMVWLVTTFAFCISLPRAWRDTPLRKAAQYNWLICGLLLIWYASAFFWGLFVLS